MEASPEEAELEERRVAARSRADAERAAASTRADGSVAGAYKVLFGSDKDDEREDGDRLPMHRP